MVPTPKLLSADRALELLREAERHAACAPTLLAQEPLTARQLTELSEEQRAKRSLVSREAVQSATGWQHVRDTIQTLGRARFAPSVAFLARVWRHAFIIPLRWAAGHALFEIDTPEAHVALQAALCDAEEHGHLPTFLAIKSIVSRTPDAAFDRLEPFLREGTDARFVGAEALRFFAPATLGRDGRTWHLPNVPELLRQDKRWVRAAVRLRRDHDLGAQARLLLSSLSSGEVDAALAETRDPTPTPPRAYAGPRDLLARYERGDVHAVWRWLREAGAIVDPALRAEALAVAEAAMRRVRGNVERITARLRAWDYPFDGFQPPWSPPSSEVGAEIERIEAAVAGPVPATLRAFWSVVGSVYWKFTENDAVDDMWRGLRLREADPFCLDGAGTAWWCIHEWQKEVEASHPEVVGPALLQLAPDYLHKANISGGMPYGFSVPNAEVDAALEHEEHALPFVDYLRLCFRWGGFPRLERVELTPEGRKTLDHLKHGLEPF